MPKHRALFYRQLDIALDLHIGNDIPFAVEVIRLTGNDHRASALRRHVVNCRLNGSRVVGKSVALRIVGGICHRYAAFRNCDGIRIFLQIRTVLNCKSVSQTYIVHRCNEHGGKAGHIPVHQREGQGEVRSLRGYAR